MKSVLFKSEPRSSKDREETAWVKPTQREQSASKGRSRESSIKFTEITREPKIKVADIIETPMITLADDYWTKIIGTYRQRHEIAALIEQNFL